MAKHQIGERVGALLSASEGEVRLLGFGVYDGYQPCPELDGFENPRITLDNGSVVWGYQCWWGAEERFRREVLRDRRIVYVDINGNPRDGAAEAQERADGA